MAVTNELLDKVERDYLPECNYRDQGDPRVLALVDGIRAARGALREMTSSPESMGVGDIERLCKALRTLGVNDNGSPTL